MRARLILPALVALILGAGAAAGEERQGRYTMSPVENGFVRLDTETGAMALCSRKDGAWSCEPMEDRAKALREQVDQLTAENQSLRAEIDRLEKTNPGGPGSGLRSERPGRSFDLPSDQDVDRALDYVERMYKKFRDRLRQLEQDEHDRKGSLEERKGTAL